MKRLWLQLLGLLPHKLPTGNLAFEEWVNSFFDTYDMPTKHKDSVKFALAAMIMHTDHMKTPFWGVYRSTYYYYLLLVSAAAKQVAGNVFEDIKNRQKSDLAAQRAAEEQATNVTSIRS